MSILNTRNLLSTQKHSPEDFSKGFLNNSKQMHWGCLKQSERGEKKRKKKREAVIFRSYCRISCQEKWTKTQQANINFCNNYKLNSSEKNPWSATRPLVSNWSQSFWRILICFSGCHQSYYPPDLCHRINQIFICNSISMEEMWQPREMNGWTLCCLTMKYLSSVNSTPSWHPPKGISSILSCAFSSKKRQ